MTYRDTTTYYTEPATMSQGTQTWQVTVNRGWKRSYMNSTNSPLVGGQRIRRENVMDAFSAYEYHGLSTVNYTGLRGVSDWRMVRLPSGDEQRLEAQRRAANAFYSELSGFRTNLAEAFATRQKTANLIAKLAGNVRDAYQHARKGRFNRAAKALADNTAIRHRAPQAVLEWQYGIKPLMGDVYDLVKNGIERRPVFRVEVRRKARASFAFLSPLMPEWQTATTGTDVGSCTIKADVVVSGWANMHSFGIDNPLLLGWELIPFSFVVDWFIRVGDYLQYLTVLNGLELENVSTTTGRLITFEQVTSPVPIFDWPGLSTGHTGKGYRKWKHRTLTVPKVPLPVFKNPFSVDHVVNAIALLAVGEDPQRPTPTRRR